MTHRYVLGAVCVVACAAAGLVRVSAPSPGSRSCDVAVPTVPSGENASGESYGSGVAGGHGTHVDLVAAIGDHCRIGYVRETDLDAGPTTLTGVRQAADEGTLNSARAIPLLAKDGQTVLDTFTLQ